MVFHQVSSQKNGQFFTIFLGQIPPFPAGSQHFGGSHGAVAAGRPLERGAEAGGGHAADAHGAAGAAETWRYFQ